MIVRVQRLRILTTRLLKCVSAGRRKRSFFCSSTCKYTTPRYSSQKTRVMQQAEIASAWKSTTTVKLGLVVNYNSRIGLVVNNNSRIGLVCIVDQHLNHMSSKLQQQTTYCCKNKHVMHCICSVGLFHSSLTTVQQRLEQCLLRRPS